MATKKIAVNDSVQQNYYYTCSEPMGENFASDFKPELTPQQMLELGIFGGCYFNGEHSEFPAEWFVHALLSATYDPKQNYFGVKASQSLQEWQRKGWVYPEDPRGWFQWYCRYYMGRRIPEEDTRQMHRWRQMTRHIGQIKAHCQPGDELCRPAQRQALLHWAYDSRVL